MNTEERRKKGKGKKVTPRFPKDAIFLEVKPDFVRLRGKAISLEDIRKIRFGFSGQRNIGTRYVVVKGEEEDQKSKKDPDAIIVVPSKEAKRVFKQIDQRNGFKVPKGRCPITTRGIYPPLGSANHGKVKIIINNKYGRK